MNKISVVLGCWYGDCAKGLITDYLSHKYGPDSINILFNGGSQRAHTIVTPESKRHVFNHFGSGTLVGCHTHFSKYFITNPIIFHREWKELQTFGVRPSVSCDPQAMITTPYDMVVNRQIEEARGHNRHGTCGLGINETILRNKIVPLKVIDLHNLCKISKQIEDVREYCKSRLQGFDLYTGKLRKFFEDKNIFKVFTDECIEFKEKISLKNDVVLKDWIKKDLHLIFEGGQGILLDEDNKEHFPHVTRSKTTLYNVTKMLESVNIKKEIDLYYVTRAYLTRHGHGPMPNETPLNIKDKTNTYNKWQEDFRTGYLDLDILNKTINPVYPRNNPINSYLCITCLDQLNRVTAIANGHEITLSLHYLPTFISLFTGQKHIITSRGETRNTITSQE